MRLFKGRYVSNAILGRSMTRPLSIAKIRALTDRGKTIREIAETLGAKYHTVYQMSRRHGLVASPSQPEVGRQKKLSRLQIDEILRAAGKGESYSSLCVQYGVSLGTIQWHVRRSRSKSAGVTSSDQEMDRRILIAIHELAQRIGSTANVVAQRIANLRKDGKL